jgi:pimeloyl-ACP methyl ester carboxylesterase
VDKTTLRQCQLAYQTAFLLTDHGCYQQSKRKMLLEEAKMLTEKTFDTGTVSIHYVEGPPSGKPLVLIHGVTSWWQTFLPVLPTFMIRYHTYALDLRGHGSSARTPGAYSVSNDVTDVVAFLRDCVQEPAILLGWSLGGMVAAFVAADAPELVRAVVLEDPPLAMLTDDDSSQAGLYERFGLLRDVLTRDGSPGDRRAALADINPLDDDVQLRRRLKTYTGFDSENLTLFIEKRKFEQKRLDAVLPRITCPVLLMQSDLKMGGALDDQTLQAALPLLADCAHVQLQNVGHGIHAEQPATFSRIVMDFLESL